jgi:hypothetical protein
VPIGLAVGGVLLLFALCLGIGALAVRQAVLFGQRIGQDVNRGLQQAAEALQSIAVFVQFRQDLADGKPEAAYGLTTDGFQKRWTLEQFKKFVADHPELADPGASLTTDDQTDTSGAIRLTATTAAGRPVSFKLRLVKDKGQWKVDEITPP